MAALPLEEGKTGWTTIAGLEILFGEADEAATITGTAADEGKARAVGRKEEGGSAGGEQARGEGVAEEIDGMGDDERGATVAGSG